MLNTNYNDWLCRLRRVVIAYKLGMISSKNVSAYQLFLTEFGQFNANFTHEEIQRLQYPLSPFANVNRHTYLRATDNWAMQMLRLKYQDDMEGKSKNLYPVFVDSKLFFNELLRYAFVINERDIDEIDENLQNCTVFIQLDNSDLTLLKSKKTNISKKLKDRNLTLLFFIQTTYSEIDAIVFVTSCNFLSQATNSIISNLGYRIDPIKIVRKIFELYPQLFIDEDDTTKVWALLKRIPMNKSNESIDTTEFDSLEKILLETIAIDSLSRIEFKRIINKNKRSYFNTYQIFDRYLLKVSLEPSFRLYADYILNIIVNPHDRYLNIPAIQLIVLPELEQTLTQIIQSLAQKTLPKLIRLTQTISEIKLLMDELSPPDEYEVYTTDNINIGKQLLADYGLQTTLYTSYAMRAFVRVLQIIDAELYNCPEVKPIISVTNQSYFEWLNNLERLKNQQYKIIKVRNLINVDQMSDIIFVELHPNNVVESTQFPHDLKKLLRIMFESWMPKGRTIVIDATLNALNDSEMKSVLTEAKPLIDNGWLNLIIIQSLTKFSQLGLDKRSAGILYILNNGKSYWDNINQRSKQLEHVEIVDRSTRHYFNYFQRTSQTSLSYLSQINKNVRFVYQQTLDQLN